MKNSKSEKEQCFTLYQKASFSLYFYSNEKDSNFYFFRYLKYNFILILNGKEWE